ncbi:hypothetical protein GCM10023169_40860 [Georgenia halophila]|uniref:Transcriptional regulator TetR C-terminal Proteobacteria type domain-containing protein n=1 Tax=Georgenia halophila TaxID=620889 RepID=A0ABP8LR25_9MICO
MGPGSQVWSAPGIGLCTAPGIAATTDSAAATIPGNVETPVMAWTGTRIFPNTSACGADAVHSSDSASARCVTTAATIWSKSGLLRASSDPAPDGDVRRYLEQYGLRQLDVVMSPRLLQLRRLVIGEVGRFPELARALYESGPRRAIDSLAAAFAKLDARGLLVADDPRTAAKTFNWLVMAAPLNEAMLMGDDAIPGTAARQRHVEHSVRVFLAAYGP